MRLSDWAWRTSGLGDCRGGAILEGLAGNLLDNAARDGGHRLMDYVPRTRDIGEDVEARHPHSEDPPDSFRTKQLLAVACVIALAVILYLVVRLT